MRATKKTPERIAAVIAGLSCGTPLTVICRNDGMPDPETVRNWMNADPELALDIAGARETGFDVIAMDVLDIVDNVEEDPASRRIRADARLKLLAKWDPKRYGERCSASITMSGCASIRMSACG